MAIHRRHRAADGRPSRRRLWRLASVALLLWSLTTGGGAAGAQDTGTATVDPRALGLESEPLVIESMGLQIHPPAGATIQLQRTEQGATVSVIDGAEIPAWSMRIQPL